MPKEIMHGSDFTKGSRNWLLHARFVRGENASCLALIDQLQQENDNGHRFAHYVKGLVLSSSGRHQDAIERFHACIKIEPHDYEAMKQVAKCLYRQGRFKLALEAYLATNKLKKHSDAEIYCGLAECSWNLGEVQEAVQWARRAVESDGGERAGSLLAKLLVQSDAIPEALAAYDNVLTSYSCGADTMAAAGALRLRSGDPRRAFQLLGAALAQQPSQHAAAITLAAMMLEHKDLDAGLARLKSALSVHPTCVAAHSNLGLALLTKKKYVAAITCLQRAAWSAPLSPKAVYNLGLSLVVCKRPASAFCRLAAAATLNPLEPYPVLLIGIVLEQLKDKRARSAYEKALTMAPEDPLVTFNVAAWNARCGNVETAYELAKKTAELFAKSGSDSQIAQADPIQQQSYLKRPIFFYRSEADFSVSAIRAKAQATYKMVSLLGSLFAKLQEVGVGMPRSVSDTELSQDERTEDEV